MSCIFSTCAWNLSMSPFWKETTPLQNRQKRVPGGGEGVAASFVGRRGGEEERRGGGEGRRSGGEIIEGSLLGRRGGGEMTKGEADWGMTACSDILGVTGDRETSRGGDRAEFGLGEQFATKSHCL